jgi:hypothetical protein
VPLETIEPATPADDGARWWRELARQ